MGAEYTDDMSNSPSSAYALLNVISWLIFILITASVAFVVVYIYRWLYKNKLGPSSRVMAVVGRKWTRQWDLNNPSDFDPILAAESYASFDDLTYVPERSTDCYIAFRTAKGELDFSVPEHIYIDLDEGEQGLLSYKGETFQRFVRDKRS